MNAKHYDNSNKNKRKEFHNTFLLLDLSDREMLPQTAAPTVKAEKVGFPPLPPPPPSSSSSSSPSPSGINGAVCGRGPPVDDAGRTTPEPLIIEDDADVEGRRPAPAAEVNGRRRAEVTIVDRIRKGVGADEEEEESDVPTDGIAD